ncbi:hypothetical protein M3F59_01975 [Brachybacterium muris]|uniref:hypothetical protein n=1 Tax=Brachybacterium muris TaxID=219301 RepID=UPI00223BFD8E|nr:hypothetical protein [Brachybacterium muris]MCT2176123.1 hypothetical protein [Brachybacterium muris]MCT2260408.1 hypothetical protein [Brachybacterium muris]
MNQGPDRDGHGAEPDHEDTVLRPAVPPQHEQDGSDVEETISWAPPASPVPASPQDGATSDHPPEDTLAPSDDFIATGLTPAPAPDPAPQATDEAPEDVDFIASAPPPSTDPESPPWGTYLHSSLSADEDTDPDATRQRPIQRSHRPADLAPIQRFDQRPRFHLPTEEDPQSANPAPASPAGGAGNSTGLPPGVDATAHSPRRKLLVPAVALGCALLLLLGIGTGVGLLWLDQPGTPAASEPPAASSEEDPADPAQWRPLEEGEQPEGTPEELLQVMATNPLTAATLSVPAGCSLPASEGKVPDEELQAYLEAGASCLATTWGQALQEQGVEFTAPEVVVHPAAEPPAASSCAPETFTGTAPRACIGDNTLYWPAEWDPGFSTTSAVESPQLYMWHLSYSYAVFAVAATSMHTYYGALLESAEGDTALTDELRRRYALQQSCFGSAAAFQQPTGPRPTDRVEEFVTSLEAQAEPASAAEPSARSRAAWVNTGKAANGDLSQCSTWEAPADQVD